MPKSATLSTGGNPAIDVFIPAVEKDLMTLPHTIDSVRTHVKHPIGDIYVVAPQSKRIMALCARKRCKFVDERAVLPFAKDAVAYRSKRWNRSGWLYQQLLKLNGDAVCKRPYFLIIDADTVLIRPHRFLIGPKAVFYCRNWSQPEYFRTYARLMGKKALRPKSFVTHYMLIESAKLSSLKKGIEKKFGTRWYWAILKAVNKSRDYGFSEFETYGNFVYEGDPGRYLLRQARNRALRTSYSALSEPMIRKLAASYRSLSFHRRGAYYARTKKVTTA